jgi:hypothetical protein
MGRRFDGSALNAMLQYFGREVALAYTVLNTTNYWAIALVGGLITALLADGKYPTVPRWAIVGISLIFLNRFFVRSYLPYANMWRWNTLIQMTLDTLGNRSSQEQDMARLDKALELYYYKFLSPRPIQSVLWDSLKFTYLWLYVFLLALFAWGWFRLQPVEIMWVVTLVLVTTTGLEVLWFVRNPLFRYEPMPKELQQEPSVEKPTAAEKATDL